MKKQAFTLLELIVAIAVIGILSGFIFSAVSKARHSADTAREISAARSLIAAYITASADRDGTLIAGYSAKESALDDRGKSVPNPASGRYPWRLAPYLDYKIKGTILVNKQEHIASIKDESDRVYRTSAHPSFGINATYVGGNERTGLIASPSTIKRYGTFVATRVNQVSEPEKLIVFASARFTGEAPGGEGIRGSQEEGFHLIAPPRTTRIEWKGEFDEDAPAKDFGYVHPRHNGRAVCVMLGGNVKLLNTTELQDMRHWCALAAEEDNPEYLLRAQR